MVPVGEAHEDFKTLQAEVQRECQEVEKLSPAGKSSLLSSLSKLLGKKKELQDLEQTVGRERRVDTSVSGAVAPRINCPLVAWLWLYPLSC